jgi:DNA repair protein RecO (recombination protein O)
MFVHYQTQGLIIKKEDRRETDRIFTIYTKNFGKLELLAKAERKIKSKLRAGLELFYLSEIEFIQGKTHKTLTDAILINNFQNLRKDLKRLKIAYQISEVLDNLVKGQEPDENIWQLLNETFNQLNNSSFFIRHSSLLYYYFLWNFLSILGYQLELYNCALCQRKLRPEKIFFSPERGGLICSQCQTSIKTKRPIKSDTVKIIRILLKRDWPILKRLKVESEDLKQLKMISHYYLSEVLRQLE